MGESWSAGLVALADASGLWLKPEGKSKNDDWNGVDWAGWTCGSVTLLFNRFSKNQSMTEGLIDRQPE